MGNSVDLSHFGGSNIGWLPLSQHQPVLAVGAKSKGSGENSHKTWVPGAPQVHRFRCSYNAHTSQDHWGTAVLSTWEKSITLVRLCLSGGTWLWAVPLLSLTSCCLRPSCRAISRFFAISCLYNQLFRAEAQYAEIAFPLFSSPVSNWSWRDQGGSGTVSEALLGPDYSEQPPACWASCPVTNLSIA